MPGSGRRGRSQEVPQRRDWTGREEKREKREGRRGEETITPTLSPLGDSWARGWEGDHPTASAFARRPYGMRPLRHDPLRMLAKFCMIIIRTVVWYNGALCGKAWRTDGLPRLPQGMDSWLECATREDDGQRLG